MIDIIWVILILFMKLHLCIFENNRTQKKTGTFGHFKLWNALYTLYANEHLSVHPSKTWTLTE